ncbi:MAG: DUF6807 family protein [Candidatus Hydrogenedentales bacterium]|jgi:hypothetical protein
MKNRWFCPTAASAVLLSIVLLLLPSALAGEDNSKVSFKKDAGRIDIQVGDRTITTYVFEDPAIPRPYFCQVKTLGGIQVTRNHPPDPVANKGNDDHPAFHPGVWLAFGDLGGSDYWRNKARVRHVRFVEPFVEETNTGRFTVVNRYERADGQGDPICEETCTYSIHVDEAGYFLVSESEFRSEQAEFAFGDQEEMGLGIRLNTPLTVTFGPGAILNSNGGANEKGTWGISADWCAATGVIDATRCGAVVMPDPQNFRVSWFHSRDYGLIVANPFGKKAMTAPKDNAVAPDSTVVRKGEPFRLGFGIYIFGVPADKEPNLGSAYDKFLKLIDATDQAIVR